MKNTKDAYCDFDGLAFDVYGTTICGGMYGKDIDEHGQEIYEAILGEACAGMWGVE